MSVSKIKIRRIEKGIKQWELASKIKVSESLLSKIETGRRQPSPRIVRKIALALGVSLSELVGG
jgi:putative transcriptional regulator